MDTKARIKMIARNILISTVVLLVLFVGVGIAYTWYMGKNVVPSDVALPTNNTSTTQTIHHVQPAENAAESASVQSLISPITPGSNSSITVRTQPYSSCTISVIYDKTPSTDSGLITKDSDEFGMVSWSWTVGSSVPIGKWPVKVTCTWKKRSAVVIGDLEVVSRIE